MFGWYETSQSDNVEYSEHTWYSLRESEGYAVEGLLLAGLQWHFAPNMSLGGEYRMSLEYSYKEYDATSPPHGYGYDRTTHDTRKQYDLTVDASRLWLSIAF